MVLVCLWWFTVLSLHLTPLRSSSMFLEAAEEDIVARVLAKHALRCDVEMSRGLVGRDTSFPYIKASSWIKNLDETGYLQNLLGLGGTPLNSNSCSTLELAGPTLRQFWSKYELAHGDHEVFNLANRGKLLLEQCVPIYIHGDEGTAYKKDGALVMSFFCPIGKGVVCQKVGDIGDGSLHMNFAGHCFKSRFVMATLFKVRGLCGFQNSF